jgi:hypothetical protein
MTAVQDRDAQFMRETRANFEVRQDVTFGESRYVDAAADMTRYSALAFTLPPGIIAGTLGGDQLVSLITPVASAYPFAPFGPLHIDYVTAKLCPRENDVTRTAIWLLVAHLLDREPIWDLDS